jgi:hypothetical protein
MSQHDLTIANQGFPAFRSDLNDALQALGSLQSGTSAPSPTFANQMWYDTTNNIVKIRNEDNDAWISVLTLDQSGDLLSAIGSVTISNIVQIASAQTFTASQRGTVTTDNDLSFNMATTNNFKCTPTAGGALTFTNITAGQSGYVLLVNGSNYAITAAATTKVGSTFLSTISATGTYLISYFTDGTNVYCTASGALS